ncbi:hypothetical protein [Paenibacillus polymyxa]|nr:hypothetical protein [Paenibacillus polymyxa]
MDNFEENNDLTLFIDILADMICHYLQTDKAVIEDSPPAHSQPDAA